MSGQRGFAGRGPGAPTQLVGQPFEDLRQPDRRLRVILDAMRYLVRAKVKPGCGGQLLRAIDEGTLGRGSIAGDEYIYDMEQARVDANGMSTWVETCFCDTPLQEERPYWEKYFELLSVKDAHARRNCRHENGTEPWACCDCDCTKRLEEKLATEGESFLEKLRRR